MNSIHVDGAELAYRVDGPEDAPPLVLINSLGTDYGVWAAQVAALRHRLKIVRYDIRGHGHSGVSATAVTIEHLADDLLALLDHLHIARTYLCGLSLGGVIAQWLAIHHPERVSRAVFANTAARIGSVDSWSARIELVQQGGMAAVRELILSRFFSPTFRAHHPEVTGTFGAMIEATNPLGYVAACAALRDADLRPLLSSIRVPSLIVVGELDQSTPPSQSEELYAAIGGSELVVLPEASHLSNVEQPEAFNTRLLRFLDGQ
jgi:3-oxoadipate enol-lactonase